MAQPATPINDLVGCRIGRFAIRARLGYGGIGEVFLADDTVLRRPVAMKAIKLEHSRDRSFRQRLLKEAERASQLNDEHIARVHDVVENQGRLFLVMEFVEAKRCARACANRFLKKNSSASPSSAWPAWRWRTAAASCIAT